jgi:ankyrin repeat protein
MEVLLDNGADINAKDVRGCTALMRISYTGYKELVQFLLDKGADKEVEDNEGNKAIHYVRKECFEDLKEMLK